jgi:hypothetical protein
MTSPFSKRGNFVLLAGSLSLVSMLLPDAFGQTLPSNLATVGLTATVTETLTVVATPATVTFTLVPSAVSGASGPISIVTTWILGSSSSRVELDGYFASATGALTNSAATPYLIPPSDVLGQVVTGTPTTFAPFTGSGMVSTVGAGLILFTQAITNANRSATRTDALNLEVNLLATPQLPAGVYAGTLTLEVNAI